jgi:hypothetical protein
METRQNGVQRFRKHYYMVVQTKHSERTDRLIPAIGTKLIEKYQQNVCVSAGGNHHG